MTRHTNPFKHAIAAGRLQTGLWLALANAYTAELAAGSGFDWLLIDGEHAPNDIRTILAQLQAVAAHDVGPVVRIPIGEDWLIKQVLDIGAQTILVPMVETAGQARQLAAAMKYPPEGVRGVGAALARASGFGARGDYLQTANDETCLLIQVESRAALASLDEILRVEGVDGIFIGTSDLAADMGHRGNPGHVAVQGAVREALLKIMAAGKPAGALSSDRQLIARYRELGAVFIAVGTDVGALRAGLMALRENIDRS